MPVFRFKALNQAGESVEGQQLAESKEAAFERIRSRGLHPVSIAPVARRKRSLKRGRLPRKVMTQTLRQLATLLTAGVPLLETLDNLKRGDSEGELAERFQALSQHLRQGGRLSEGLKERFPELPAYAFSLAALGESTGQLPRTLMDAADRMTADDALATELRSALTYPLILASVGGLIVFAMFVVVIPRFGGLVDRSGAEIPAISRLVIEAGTWMQSNWVYALVGAGVFAASVRLAIVSNAKLFRRWSASAPISGPLIRKLDLESWARTLGLALANGSQLLPALDLAEQTVRAPELANQLKGVRRDVRGGAQLDEAFEINVSRADPMLLDLMATGRKSGTLHSMLLFAADSYRSEITTLSKRLTAIAEPVAILLISSIVGLLVVSIVLAMTSLYNFDI